jgi:hypothetical protein
MKTWRSPVRWVKLLVLSSALACGEAGDLAVSAGAPVVGAVQGTITACGIAVPDAEVRVQVDQEDIGQARPVHTEVGPVTSDARGRYALDVSPAFAVPGPAVVQLRVIPPGGDLHELPGRTMRFSLGEVEDTLRLDADLCGR